MIYRVCSTLPSFKTLEFRPGLNILLSKKTETKTPQQTRNKTGKTSFVKIIHFLLGERIDDKSIFKLPALANFYFDMELDLGANLVKIARSGQTSRDIFYSEQVGLFGFPVSEKISLAKLQRYLGDAFFKLAEIEEIDNYRPNIKSLLSYFARQIDNIEAENPEIGFKKQKKYEYQISLMYLLGLDWKIGHDWQKVRDLDKTLKTLMSSAKSDLLGGIFDDTRTLRRDIQTRAANLNKMRRELSEFKILPHYRILEDEMKLIDIKINKLTNSLTIDQSRLSDLKNAIDTENPPTVNTLDKIYAEAKVTLPDIALRRYDEVQNFHQSIIKNRVNYLTSEMYSTQERLNHAESERYQLDARRSQILNILKAHGALDQFLMLQEEVSRLDLELTLLKEKLERILTIEKLIEDIPGQRQKLMDRMTNELSLNNEIIKEAYNIFRTISAELYGSPWSFKIESTPDGPEFVFKVQGARSGSIRNMVIFCFDIMLTSICASNNIGPGFLVHDSSIFNVDGRQIISALKIGAEYADKYGFQYIVTMNDDDVFKEEIDGFDISKFILPTNLTDAHDGGLFGIQF